MPIFIQKFAKSLSILVLLSTITPSTVFAQNGLMWAESQTRRIRFQFAGDVSIPPQPFDRSINEVIESFKQLCLDIDGDSEKINSVINKMQSEKIKLNLIAQPFTVPSESKSPPIVMKIWQGSGITVYQTNGDSLIKRAQCNIRYHLNSPANIAELNSALENMIGTKPFNASSEFKKNGKPANYYSPQWEIKNSNGIIRVVTADVDRSDLRKITIFLLDLSKRASK